MTTKDILLNAANALEVPPSENAIPAILSEIQSVLDHIGSPARTATVALSDYWTDTTDPVAREDLIDELRRLATR